MNGISFFCNGKNCYALSVKKKTVEKYREAVERLPSTLPRKSVVVATTVVLSFLEKDLERTSLKKQLFYKK